MGATIELVEEVFGLFELAKRCRERYFPYYYEEVDEPEEFLERGGGEEEENNVNEL